MKLFLLKQREATGWDTYDSCVVVAESAEEARKIHPDDEGWPEVPIYSSETWAFDTNNVTATYLGEACIETAQLESKVICSSFNAG